MEASSSGRFYERLVGTDENGVRSPDWCQAVTEEKLIRDPDCLHKVTSTPPDRCVEDANFSRRRPVSNAESWVSVFPVPQERVRGDRRYDAPNRLIAERSGITVTLEPHLSSAARWGMIGNRRLPPPQLSPPRFTQMRSLARPS